MKGIVLKTFRDIKDFSKVYKPGDEVDFDESRIEKCVSLGLVKVEDAGTDGQADKQQGSGDNTKKGIIVVAGQKVEKTKVLESLKKIGVEVADDIADDTLIEKLNELDEEQGNSLKKELGIEETAE